MNVLYLFFCVCIFGCIRGRVFLLTIDMRKKELAIFHYTCQVFTILRARLEKTGSSSSESDMKVLVHNSF